MNVGEISAIVVLGGIVIAQQFVIAGLTSKLMARSFSEWVTGEKAMKLKPVPREKEVFEDDYAANQALKANQIFRI